MGCCCVLRSRCRWKCTAKRASASLTKRRRISRRRSLRDGARRRPHRAQGRRSGADAESTAPMSVFLDAKILFSAAKSNGAGRELLVRLRAAGHILCADEYVLAEARRNLERKGAEAVTDFARLRGEIDLA